MNKILICGAGRVGMLVGSLLSSCGDYNVHLADINVPNSLPDLGEFANPLIFSQFDVTDRIKLVNYIKENKFEAVVSCLPFFCNVSVAETAQELNIHYFDLTEDVNTTTAIEKIAQSAKKIFAPQCGLAPGFISVVANELVNHFDKVDTLKMRVGALPINISNALQYGLTWSTQGLVNEYIKPCRAIQNGELVTLAPMAGLEKMKIDGVDYEAFNTSGGVGSMIHTYRNKVKNMTYKTARYPGHCKKVRFLLEGLKLKGKPEIVEKIFEAALPHIQQDMVLVYVSAKGDINNRIMEESFAERYYSKDLFGNTWTALQMTTASSLCVTIDLAIAEKCFTRGFLKQEQISLQKFLDNRFGQYFKPKGSLPKLQKFISAKKKDELALAN